MRTLFQDLLDNESGLILSAEMVLILTICVLGVITGLACVQTAVVSELQDISLAFSGLNQSYFTPAFFGCRKWWGGTSFTAGSGFIDINDTCGGWGSAGGFGYGAAGGYAEISGVVDRGPASVSCPPGEVDCPPVSPQPATPCDACTPGPGTVLPTPAPVPPVGPAAPVPAPVAPHAVTPTPM